MTYAVEDLINMGLRAAGLPMRVETIYEGSDAAKVALEIYGETRDALLQEGDWPFAMAEVLLVTNGQTPPTPWSYEYSYPSDCLRVRNVKLGPLTGGTVDYDPQPQLYRPWYDTRVPARAILANVTPAILVYNAKVTNPASWEPGYIDALVAELGKKFALAFPQNKELLGAAMNDANQAKLEGMMVDDISAPAVGIDRGPDAGSARGQG